MKAPTPAIVGFAAACIAGGLTVAPLRAELSDAVAVAAGADRDYVRARTEEGGPMPRTESYVVAEGRHFGGSLSDPSAEKLRFGEVVKSIVPGLAEQRYFPASDKRDARLLIVVHWGTTQVEDDPTGGTLDFSKFQSDMGAYNGELRTMGPLADPSRMNSDLDVVSGKSSVLSASPAFNAILLGFAPELRRQEYLSLGAPSGMTAMDRRIRDELEDPRYFVIVMAYELKNAESGERLPRPKLVWSVHLSTPASGQDFPTALTEMGGVAAGYVGRNVDGLVLDASSGGISRPGTSRASGN